MSVPRCKCTLSVSLTGDGCRYCQPQEHIERMGEWLNEERDEITALHAENKELQAMVSALVEALEQIRAIDDELYGGDWDEIEKARNIANEALVAYYKGEEA